MQFDIYTWVNTILLTLLLGLGGWIFRYLKKLMNRFLNKVDMHDWKISSMNFGIEESSIGEKYKQDRDNKWDDLVERDQLINKKR